jgi:dCTP deaminase
MTVLGNRAFIEALDTGRLLIDPRPTNDRIGTSAIDLLLAGEFKRWKQPAAGMEHIIDPSVAGFSFQRIAAAHLEAIPTDEDGSIILRPGRFVLGRTKERVELPLESGFAARVEGRSSLARCGVGIHVTAPTIHAGWRGTITLEITNHGTLPMRLRPGLPICQLIVERVAGRGEGEHRTSFQNQDTITGPSKSA